MSLLDGIRRQLRSVIEWENPGPHDLFIRWSDNGDEIKDASKLIIGPGQGCIFVYEGRIRAVTVKEGMINLKTDNIPFWTTISRLMQSFESEHKIGIYYFRTAKILDQKWGTSSPVKYNDPVYNFPVGLRAFGNYSFRITDPEHFFVNVVGGSEMYSARDFREVMMDRIIQPLTDYLAEARLSYGEIDAKREEIAAGIESKLRGDFEQLGFEITDFRVEGTSFDEDTMRRINRIADMTAEAQAAQAAGLNYAQVQQLDAMKDAARNEGGGAGMGMGLGAGMGFGQMMAGVMGSSMGQPQGTPHPHQPEAAASHGNVTERLRKVKKLLDAGLITQQEYDEKKRELLDGI